MDALSLLKNIGKVPGVKQIGYLLGLYVDDGRRVVRLLTRTNIRDFDLGAASALYDGMPEVIGDYQSENKTRILNKVETRRPSSVWYEILTVPKGIEILDPDGWNRKDFANSWEKELVTEREYEQRLSVSTLRWYQNRRP